jgi:putative transposase
VLGGRKIAIRRPRARTADGEVPLPTFQAMAQTDPLDCRIVEQMLAGVATRQCARSLEPLEPAIASRSTSKSTVSRRFIARTQRQLDTWRSRPLDDLVLTVLLFDGLHVCDHCLIVPLGMLSGGWLALRLPLLHTLVRPIYVQRGILQAAETASAEP